MRGDEGEGLEASMGRNWMAIKAESLLEADWPMADKEWQIKSADVTLLVCLRLIKCDD